MTPPASTHTAAPAKGEQPAGAKGPVRKFGRFQLLRLLGKSDRSMAWAVIDSRSQLECALIMPRQQVLDEAKTREWRETVERSARLSHPCVVPVLEIGEQDHWPYVVYDRSRSTTWLERFSREGWPPADVARWTAEAAQGLAYAHEAGVAHHDLQPWMLVITDEGRAAVWGLEVAAGSLTSGGAIPSRQAQRQVAERDVLGLGLVMYQALAGEPALDEPDVDKVVHRLPPWGTEIVRLPWALRRPVPDPLRAMVNRATDRQERHRYRSARTLQKALEGWLKTIGDHQSGPLALLMDRIAAAGVLPAQPGGAERVAHLALMERCRTNELADLVLGDIALTFELLRLVNVAKVSSDGPILMLRRAIAMLGINGVRRAALGLRAWPGPMNEPAAVEMQSLIGRVHQAARLAVRLVPAGYDSEVIYLITLMQNLGRLVVQYHFPEEAHQIQRLMTTLEAGHAGATESQPGMSPEAASFAVLGADVDELGQAVARHWGLDDSVLGMFRRIGLTEGRHGSSGDGDVLRHAASCANDLLESTWLPPLRAQLIQRQAIQRHAKILGISGREMLEALQNELRVPAVPKKVSLPESILKSDVVPDSVEVAGGSVVDGA